MDFVDATRTVSNDIVEVSAVFGIEAACKIVLSEFRNVISFDGNYANYRRFACIANFMTVQECLIRVGQEAFECGPLLYVLSGDTIDTLTHASLFIETENLGDSPGY